MYLNNATSTDRNRDAQTQVTRESIIIQNLGRVHTLANQLRSRVPESVTIDDLIGAGTIGLIQAAERFQPSRGLQFATYAKHRIRGAMLDFLREEDPLSRTERRLQKRCCHRRDHRFPIFARRASSLARFLS